MAYLANSTFVTFPNGEVQDVAGCGWTVQGNNLLIIRAGVTLYSYKFANPSDVRAFINVVALAMLSYNTNPANSYEWSTDAETWEFGTVPVNAMPCYLQVFGPNMSGATTCTLTDSSNRVFNLQVFVVSNNAIVVGPFNQPGTNTPALGNSTLFVFNAGSSIIASLVIPFGPAQVLAWTPQTPGTLVEWLKADVGGLSTPISSWTASAGLNATGTGTQRPSFVAIGQNGLPVVRFDQTVNILQTASFASAIAQPLTIAIAYRDNTSGHNERYFNGVSNTVAFGVLNGSVFINAGSLPPPIALFDSNFHYLFIVLNGASTTYSFDGAALQTMASSPGTNSLDALSVAPFTGSTGTVDIGEIIVWSGDGTTFFLDASQYLMSRWA